MKERDALRLLRELRDWHELIGEELPTKLAEELDRVINLLKREQEAGWS